MQNRTFPVCLLMSVPDGIGRGKASMSNRDGALSIKERVHGHSDSVSDDHTVIATTASDMARQRACRLGLACDFQWLCHAGSVVAGARLVGGWSNGAADRAL